MTLQRLQSWTAGFRCPCSSYRRSRQGHLPERNVTLALTLGVVQGPPRVTCWTRGLPSVHSVGGGWIVEVSTLSAVTLVRGGRAMKRSLKTNLRAQCCSSYLISFRVGPMSCPGSKVKSPLLPHSTAQCMS